MPPSAGNMWLSPGAGGAHKAQVERPELVLGRVSKYSQCGVGLENQGQVISSSFSMWDGVCISLGWEIGKHVPRVADLPAVLGEACEAVWVRVHVL